MLTTSRREFLKLSGVSVAAVHLASLDWFAASSANLPQATQGRVLFPVELRGHRGEATRLIPDALVNIRAETADGLYRVDGGFVDRTYIQPLFPLYEQPNAQPSDTPYWSEVIDPVALVYQWCAADAPIVSRIGQGGVMRVVDALPGRHRSELWLQVASHNGRATGWTPAMGWQPVEQFTEPVHNISTQTLTIDLSKQQLTAAEDGQPVLQAPVSTSPAFTPGQYSLQSRCSGGIRVDGYNGSAWVTDFGVARIAGVYWHNRFGLPANSNSIQVSPLVARWLYGWLNEYTAMTLV